MNLTKRLLIALVVAVVSLAASADSPLTSTTFGDGDSYASHPIVQLAARSDLEEFGPPERLLEFVADPNQPTDERLAVVSRIGWDKPECQNEVADAITIGLSPADYGDAVERLDAGSLIVLAYAVALGDYFNVETARYLAHEAVEKNAGNEFSIDLIAALIDAQHYLDVDWSQVSPPVNAVLAAYDESRRDLHPDVVKNIMDYISLYDEY